MSSAGRRAREKEATREKILAAARALFLEEGVESVSMRKIAEAIDYTAAAIYSHFPDKMSLLGALCDRDFGALRESMRHVESIADPVERLRGMGRAYVDFAFAHPHHYRFMFMSAHHEEVGVPEVCEQKHGNPDQDGYAFLRRVVGECIAAKKFGTGYRDEKLVTQMYWGAAHGVVSLFITHGRDPWVEFEKPRETAYALLDASLAGVLAPVSARRGARKKAPAKRGARR